MEHTHYAVGAVGLLANTSLDATVPQLRSELSRLKRRESRLTSALAAAIREIEEHNNESKHVTSALSLAGLRDALRGDAAD